MRLPQYRYNPSHANGSAGTGACFVLCEPMPFRCLQYPLLGPDLNYRATRQSDSFSVVSRGTFEHYPSTWSYAIQVPQPKVKVILASLKTEMRYRLKPTIVGPDALDRDF